MKAKKATMRALPAILMLAAVVFFGNLGKGDLGQKAEAQGWGSDQLEMILLTLSPSPLPCPVAGGLIEISEQAAALTGSLALIEKDDRPQAAARVATDIRTLQQRAATQPGGADLGWVLGNLAEALEAYAGGDPLAIGGLREASARNAGIRETLKQQQTICGGKQ